MHTLYTIQIRFAKLRSNSKGHHHTQPTNTAAPTHTTRHTCSHSVIYSQYGNALVINVTNATQNAHIYCICIYLWMRSSAIGHDWVITESVRSLLSQFRCDFTAFRSHQIWTHLERKRKCAINLTLNFTTANESPTHQQHHRNRRYGAYGIKPPSLSLCRIDYNYNHFWREQTRLTKK